MPLHDNVNNLIERSSMGSPVVRRLRAKNSARRRRRDPRCGGQDLAVGRAPRSAYQWA